MGDGNVALSHLFTFISGFPSFFGDDDDEIEDDNRDDDRPRVARGRRHARHRRGNRRGEVSEIAGDREGSAKSLGSGVAVN